MKALERICIVICISLIVLCITSCASVKISQHDGTVIQAVIDPEQGIIINTTVKAPTEKSYKPAFDKWGETQSLDVATEWAGISFLSPDETFITENGKQIDLTTYRYRTNIVEALYRGDDYEIIFRRSDEYQGSTLSEDTSSYEYEWDMNIDNTVIHCASDDGEHINMAYFDADNDHFSVICHMGSEGTGFTPEDLHAFLAPVLKM